MQTFSQCDDSRRIGYRVIGDLITNAVRATPAITATTLRASFLGDYALTISYDNVWRGLEVARGALFGSYEDSFNELV